VIVCKRIFGGLIKNYYNPNEYPNFYLEVTNYLKNI